MTEAEKAARSIIVGQLVRGESLAKCLGGVVQAMKLCGTSDEQRMAAIADAAIMKVLTT